MTRPLKPATDRRAINDAVGRINSLERRTPGPWQYVGDPSFVPFTNGSNAAPTAGIPDPVPLRIRWTLGAGLEIQGDVTGLSPGDEVCTFPADYSPEHDSPVHGHDDTGNYVPCRLYSDGRFVYGVV